MDLSFARQLFNHSVIKFNLAMPVTPVLTLKKPSKISLLLMSVVFIPSAFGFVDVLVHLMRIINYLPRLDFQHPSFVLALPSLSTF